MMCGFPRRLKAQQQLHIHLVQTVSRSWVV
jgi:hypothetical protein